MAKWIKRLLVVVLVLTALTAAAWCFRAPLLRGVARAWIINQPLSKADVIVVLGGGPDTRPFEAARLYHAGLAPKILVMKPRLAAATEIGVLPSEGDLTRDILLQQNVPTNAILMAQNYVTNSYDESITIRDWARANGARTVIVPTDIFHTRRVHWLYGKEFKRTGIQVEVEAVPVRDYTVADWWRHEQGIIAFQNEVLKYGYYRLKY